MYQFQSHLLILNVNGYLNAQGNITTAGNVICQRIVASQIGSAINGFASSSHSHSYASVNHGHNYASPYHSHYSDDRIKYNETLLTDHLTIINKLVPKRYEKIVEILLEKEDAEIQREECADTLDWS